MNTSSEIIVAESVDAIPIVNPQTTAVAGSHQSNDSDVSKPRLGRIRRIWNFIAGCIEWVFGLICMVIGLSIIATVPLIQVLSLGYLLELSARVTRTGQIREAFTDIRSWARFGGAIMAGWLLLLPLRLIADLRYSAMLLENQPAVRRLGVIMTLGFVFVVTHIVWSIYRGGRIRHFAWPAPLRFMRQIRAGGMYSELRDRLFEWLNSLNVNQLAMQGLRGLGVAFTWLLLPISLMVLASRLPEGGAFALSFVSALLLSAVLIYLPFLQINAAVDRSFPSGLQISQVRRQFARAPIAYWFALLLTLLLAIPLYVLKAELIPREAAWLPSIVFVISILPARILTAWAVSRGDAREEKRHWFFRHGARMFTIPVVLTYVFVVYLTQYVSWYGPLSLYEQHAFLLPVPFIGL